MTEREYPGPDEQATPEQGAPGVQSSAGSASDATAGGSTGETTDSPETEPTRPYPGTFGQVDPSWPQPQVASAPVGYPVPGQAPAGYPVDHSVAPTTESTAPGGTSRLPGWTWPLISVLALVLGLVGGAVAGSLVSSDNGSSSGGVLSVQRRTAAPLPADSNSVAAVSA